MGRGDPSDAEWERLRPFLPVSNKRCGRWRDHRQVIDGFLHRVRTGVQWRDLPERFGPRKTVYERRRLWSGDGTWERLLQQVEAAADTGGEIDWNISVDSPSCGLISMRPAPAPVPERRGETTWRSLHARLAAVGAGSEGLGRSRGGFTTKLHLSADRAVATRCDKRRYVCLGTATVSALTIWLRT
ncbi:IS5 family transposase [Streptomyces nojiriensis]|uniref:IS5 family transposase n=1 Tax=Streptomyces nojiriensis TaxID=66374 RepID=UPI0035D7414D